MTIFFVLGTKKNNNSLVDIAWGLGFVLVALSLMTKNCFIAARELLVFALILAWGIRLALHIYLRNKGKGEDCRYKAMRENWGKHPLINAFFKVYMLQGLLMLLVAAPIIIVNADYAYRPLGFFDLAGFLLWALGFFFEAVGDWQLSKFIKDPANKGKIMTSGLWKFTRHPNYFGEVAMWWGLFLIALSSSFGYLALISPLTITFLLLKVSGIPMLEAKYAGNAEFEEYKKRTNAFFPWFPKKIK